MQKKENKLRHGLAVLIFGMAFLMGTNVFGSVAGNIDGIGEVDLKDVIMSLQISAGITPTSYVYKKYEINSNSRIGIEEAVYGLQAIAGLRAKAFLWYKDADGDRYSDGVKQISSVRPAAIYFQQSELIAISGDANDNDPNIHPNATPQWTAFDDTEPADPSDTLSVSVPTDTSQEVVIEYSIPGMNTIESPEEGQIYNILNIAGCGYTNEIGKPKLPVISRYVAVPEGAAISKEVIDSSFRDITGYKVYPVQEPLPDVDDVLIPPFTMDTGFYQAGGFYPSEIVKMEGPVIIRGVSTIILQIHPVQYDPAQSKLRVYSNIKVRITFSGGGRAIRDQRLRSPSFDEMLGRLVVNPDLLFSGRDSRTAYDSGNSLLIITHPNFLEAANTLKSWKIKKGIYTEVRTTNETGAAAAAIQNYIKTAYNTWATPPTYVLLIGDAEFIPTHYKTWHPFNGSTCLSYGLPFDCSGHTGTDLYYSTVDGADYFPDINLGRLSVDTLAQANKRVNDIIGYEKAVVTDSNFYKNAAVCAYFQHGSSGYDSRRFAQTSEDLALFLSDSKYLGQYSVDRIYYAKPDVTPMYWSTDSRYSWQGPAGKGGDAIPSHLRKPGFAWNGNYSNISTAINNGRFLVIHRDHGAEWGWGDPYYNTGHVQALTNGSKLPVVWSINCQTGWFDNETDAATTNTSSNALHFSEAWERNPNGGAVGIIAATRVSYSGHNDRLVWGWTDAIWPGFESYSPSNTPFNNPAREMGPVLNYGKYYYATKYGDDLYRKTEFELFHWFGDPTMQIWTDVPQTLTVSHPSSLSSGAASISVSVNQADAVICVSKNGAILSRKMSVNGANTLSWSGGLVQGDVIYVTVTKHNFRPYEGNANCAAACTYSISPASNSFTASAGTGSVSVTAGTGCSWTAVSNNISWLTVTSGASGTGNGAVGYSVLANTTASSRTGTLTIAGKTFTVTQAAPCTYSISPTSNSFTASAGTGSVSVTAGTGCSWTAVSNNTSWLTVTSGASGTGNGAVGYSVLANTTASSRTGTLTIAGKTFTVTQSGSPVVVFPDPNLEAEIRTAINKPLGDILRSDLENLTGLTLLSKSIKNIEGIQYCINLTSLDLTFNQINDISPLAGLTNLIILHLNYNQINNISAVAGLTNLIILHLNYNQISNISAVAGLTNLTELSLSSNQISNISAVAGLTNLTVLNLDSNQISNISAVAGLTNLTVLILGGNQINDISAVTELTNLMVLSFSSNQISNISAMAGLTNMTRIDLSSNQISDISAVAGLINLIVLDLYGNQISDIKPLVDNSGIGSGDTVYLYSQYSGSGNPLSATSCNVYVPQLLSRGVDLYHNCP